MLLQIISMPLSAALLVATLLLTACASAPEATVESDSPLDPADAWRDAKVVVVTADQLSAGTVQTPGMIRAEAISGAMAGSEKLWVGKVTLPPGAVSGVHHHGPLETAAYVIRGRSRFFWGPNLENVAEAGPGDFMYIPPYTPHQETNASDTEPMEAVVIRSDQQPVVVELEIPGAAPAASAPTSN